MSDPESASATNTAPPTFVERFAAAFRRPGTPVPSSRPGPPPRDYSRMSDEEKRELIVRLDTTERRVGFVGVVASVILTLAFVLPYMVEKIAVVSSTVVPKKGKCPTGFTYAHSSGKAVCKIVYPPSHYIPELIVPLVLAAVLLVTIRYRRRTFTAFVLIMVGLSMGVFLLLLPFAAAGVWIMLRAWRVQKYGAPNVKVAQPGWTPPAPKAGRRGAASASSRSSTKSKTSPDTRNAPSANKRYTPRTPPKPVKKGR